MTETERDQAKEIFDKIKTQDQPETVDPVSESAETTEWPEEFEKRLLWDNHTPESIELMRGLPGESVQKMYDDIGKRQERVDALYRDRERLERAASERQQAEATKVETQPSKPTLTELLGDEADLLDPKVVEALEAYYQPATPAAAPVQETPAQDMTALNAAMEANRVRLQSMYSGVRLDGAEWDVIARQADTEWDNPSYDASNPDEKLSRVFDTVMFRLYGPGRSVQETTTQSGPVTRNSAAASSASKTPTADLSTKDREKLMFEHLKRNPGDADGARKIAGLEPRNVHPRLRR